MHTTTQRKHSKVIIYDLVSPPKRRKTTADNKYLTWIDDEVAIIEEKAPCAKVGNAAGIAHVKVVPIVAKRHANDLYCANERNRLMLEYLLTDKYDAKQRKLPAALTQSKKRMFERVLDISDEVIAQVCRCAMELQPMPLDEVEKYIPSISKGDFLNRLVERGYLSMRMLSDSGNK